MKDFIKELKSMYLDLCNLDSGTSITVENYVLSVNVFTIDVDIDLTNNEFNIVDLMVSDNEQLSTIIEVLSIIQRHLDG